MSRRDNLRRATGAAHQALHRAAPFAAIADGTATRLDYAATLKFLHRFHTAMAPLARKAALALGEPRLAQAHAARIALLEVDLACLEEKAEPSSALEEVCDTDFCIGALYTVQGSTLGGKVIHRQLDGLISGEAGRGFFKGHPDDGRDWQALCAALERHTGDMARLEAGALHAFGRFADMLADSKTCH